MTGKTSGLALLALLWPLSAFAQSGACQKPLTDAVLEVPVSGNPFSAIPSADGCTVFVSLTGGGKVASGLAVLTRQGGAMMVAQTVKAEGQLTGLALSPDGHYLAGANGSGISLFDVARLTSGADKPLLGYLNDSSTAGSIYAVFSPDEKLLFVSDERSGGISVHDFAGLLAGRGDRVIGAIRTGAAPVGLALSPDGRFLYSTSEALPGPSRACAGEGGGPAHDQGELIVIDVAKAASAPGDAVVARHNAGCNPVRVALSADGANAYVTARGEDALLVFNTAKLMARADDALAAKIPVGKAPVGVLAAGPRIFVTNSDRFGGNKTQSITVLNAASPSTPAKQIAAGGFPRELNLLAKADTLIITNFTSRTVEFADLSRVPAP